MKIGKKLCIFSQTSPKHPNSSSSQSTLSYHSTQQSGYETDEQDTDHGNEIQKDEPEKG